MGPRSNPEKYPSTGRDNPDPHSVVYIFAAFQSTPQDHDQTTVYRSDRFMNTLYSICLKAFFIELGATI